MSRRMVLAAAQLSGMMYALRAAGVSNAPRRVLVIDEVGPYPVVSPPYERPKTPADLERLAAAQAKRDRRAAKRGQR